MQRIPFGDGQSDGDGPTDDGAKRGEALGWTECTAIVLLLALALVVRLLVGEFLGV